MLPNPDRRHVLAALAAGILALGGCSPGRGKAADVPDVHVITMNDNLKFDPPVLQIHVGDQVLWRNDSLLVHTVTADPALAALPASARLPAGAAAFNSGNLDPKASFAHKFTKAGKYKYFCIPHEAAGMAGAVVVLP